MFDFLRRKSHDFQDGRGRVRAHRHKNGGGWVSDAAHVEGCYVGKDAEIGGFAWVANSSIYHRAKVQGVAYLDKCFLYDNAFIGEKAVARECSLWDNGTVVGAAVIRNGVCLAKEGLVSEHATVIGPFLIKGHVTAYAYLYRDDIFTLDKEPTVIYEGAVVKTSEYLRS